MKYLFAVLCCCISLISHAADGDDPTRAKMSGTPRLIREDPTPQVFFNELSGSLQISTTGDYNRIMNALIVGLRKKMPVNIIVNKKTGIIVDVDAPIEKRDTTMYEEVTDENQKEQKSEKKEQDQNEKKKLEEKQMKENLDSIMKQFLKK